MHVSVLSSVLGLVTIVLDNSSGRTDLCMDAMQDLDFSTTHYSTLKIVQIYVFNISKPIRIKDLERLTISHLKALGQYSQYQGLATTYNTQNLNLQHAYAISNSNSNNIDAK